MHKTVTNIAIMKNKIVTFNNAKQHNLSKEDFNKVKTFLIGGFHPYFGEFYWPITKAGYKKLLKFDYFTSRTKVERFFVDSDMEDEFEKYSNVSSLDTSNLNTLTGSLHNTSILNEFILSFYHDWVLGDCGYSVSRARIKCVKVKKNKSVKRNLYDFMNKYTDFDYLQALYDNFYISRGPNGDFSYLKLKGKKLKNVNKVGDDYTLIRFGYFLYSFTGLKSLISNNDKYKKFGMSFYIPDYHPHRDNKITFLEIIEENLSLHNLEVKTSDLSTREIAYQIFIEAGFKTVNTVICTSFQEDFYHSLLGFYDKKKENIIDGRNYIGLPNPNTKKIKLELKPGVTFKRKTKLKIREDALGFKSMIGNRKKK
jgi:hypothetical protein